jgi:hypothetical protein
MRKAEKGLFPIIIFIFLFSMPFFACSSDSANAKQESLLVLRGKIIAKKEFTGTLSEYRYFVVQRNSREEYIIFNEKGRSLGFGKYENRSVTIKGKKITGIVGWKNEKREGIQVVEIELSVD